MMSTEDNNERNVLTIKRQPNVNQTSTKKQPNVNQSETEYRLGKDSIVKDYVVVADKIKESFYSFHQDCDLDIEKYIYSNMISIGRIVEAYSFDIEGYKEILVNISLFVEISDNYSKAKIEVINNLDEKEYQKIFDKIQIATSKIKPNDIIDTRAFVSSYISKCVNKHLSEKGDLNDDRIEYQW